MLKILQNKYINYSLIAFFLILIVVLRWQENNLFYDPFLKYFKNVFQGKPLPDYNFLLLIFNYFVRFFINSFLSILIIYLIFNDHKINQLLIYIYSIIFILLLLALIIVLILNNPDYNFVLFYIRRFLIQPLFLILFVPAIYFQKIAKKN